VETAKSCGSQDRRVRTGRFNSSSDSKKLMKMTKEISKPGLCDESGDGIFDSNL